MNREDFAFLSHQMIHMSRLITEQFKVQSAANWG